jgi:hypothetical protein
MNLDFLIKDYKKCYSYESLIDKNKVKSEEVYFGVDNPLRTGLIHHLTIIKELITKARERNPSIRGLELVDICQDEFNKMSKVIEESFNVEKCAIGFQNAVNACCFPQIYNKKIAGRADGANLMRIKLDDIVETKNGFRYRDGKGIYYAICVGLQFFYSDIFSVPEVACILVHELGHAMQHVVHSINANYAIAYWASIMKNLEMGFLDPIDVNQKTSNVLKLISKYHKNKEYEKLSKIGKEILDETPKEEMVDFDKLDSHELTAICNDEIPIDGSDLETIPKKKNIFVRTIIGILKIPLSILFAIFLVPLMIYYKLTLKNKKAGLWKNDEMTADAFEVFYGFAAEAGEAAKKLSKYRNITGDQGLINYVPLLNLWKCDRDLRREYIQMIFGYPSEKQRLVNAYIGCEFELKNNKDLSEEAKKELKEQIESLKDTYTRFVTKHDTRGGFIYRIASIIGANTLEKAAQKDPSLREAVLEPLMKKKDEGAFK